jgi:cobalt-zinc-cadmium resistance protein CzcA
MSDIEDMIELAIGGRAIGTVFEGERRFNIAGRLVSEARSDATAIGNILVPAPEGGRIPLSQLADIEVRNGATIIARRENKRSITVRTNIRGRDQGGFVNEAQTQFAREVKLPDGYQVVWGGQFENLDRARKRLSVILPITILIIFGLLFTAFGSVRDAGIALLNVPFSFVGGVIGLYLRGINFSVSAAVGFVTLFGVAVMGGLLYIAEIKRRRPEPGVTLEQAVVEGAKAQVRPLLLLIVVALLGMIPAATATGIGSDVQRPLATVIIGGLLSTLVLTLLVLPSLYYIATSKTRPARTADQ